MRGTPHGMMASTSTARLHCPTTMSPAASAYLRQPSLHGDTVVFVSDDDLWRASVHGGVAQRLTAGLSEPATP